jgi:hypothetical protein
MPPNDSNQSVLLFCLPGIPNQYDFLVRELLRADIGADTQPKENIAAEDPRPALAPLLVARALTAEVDRSLKEGTFARILIVVSDPRDCAAALMVGEGMDLIYALRAVSRGCASFAPLLRRTDALVEQIHIGESIDVSRAALIADYLGLRLSTRAIGDVVSAANAQYSGRPSLPGHLASPSDPADKSSFPRWKQFFSPSESIVVDKILGGYASLFDGGELGPIRWPPEAFILGDDPKSAPVGVVDMTGKFRCLVFGPYLHLPPGRWCATTILAAAADAFHEQIAIDVFTDKRLAEKFIPLDRPGVYRISVEFEVLDPTIPIQVRISNLRAPFEGRIALGDVELSLLE